MQIKLNHFQKKICGTIRVPGSKSYAQRAIALSSLSAAKSTIHNLTMSEDVKAALRIVKDLGSNWNHEQDGVSFEHGISMEDSQQKIHCKESGLSSRLFSSFSLLYTKSFTISGKGSLELRTMEMIINGLREFGKEVESNSNKLPITISGSIKSNQIRLDGSISSQFLTGLLIVSPFLKTDTEVFVQDLKSIPYIEMTLEMLTAFGLKITHDQFKHFKINGNQRISAPKEYTVEGDWSSASFWVVAGAINGSITLKGLQQNSAQGDREIVRAVEKSGAKIEWKDGELTVAKNKLSAFEFDATECPDLFPPLVVLAAHCKGKSVIKGVHRLAYKESNRGLTLQEECLKIGVIVGFNGDEMHIIGGDMDPVIQEVIFSSHNDHRIAMAMSLFVLTSSYDIQIENAEAINKSYPHFFEDLKQLY